MEDKKVTAVPLAYTSLNWINSGAILLNFKHTYSQHDFPLKKFDTVAELAIKNLKVAAAVVVGIPHSSEHWLAIASKNHITSL